MGMFNKRKNDAAIGELERELTALRERRTAITTRLTATEAAS
jgi:hypothetical protein